LRAANYPPPRPASLFFGLESAQRTPEKGLDLTGVALFEYRINPLFGAGVKILGGGDFRGVYSLEVGGFFRWYYLRFSKIQLFAQADLGLSLATSDADVKLKGHDAKVMAGAGLGARFYVLDKTLFLEPAVRWAYPSGFGVGLVFGWTPENQSVKPRGN
jgi:hypothetical protein